MRTKTSALIALPTALLLALSLSACDEESVSTTPTDSSSSSSSDSSASTKDKDSKDSEDSDDASATPSSKAGSSASADGRTVSIGDLKTGDCVSEMVDETRGGRTGTSEAKVVDCSAPHQYEMIGTAQSTASSYAESNTPEEISTVCEPLLQSYVGSPSKAENYMVAALTPMQSSWDQGDHEFTCFAQNEDDSPLNKSIKNS
ncbi:septum formation family protein [Actinomyces sp. ZJ308]|uniref:septum formation family protein n=1 Tax=Actinomyces sp. ZJ308 TaxID=2708342 RepID=UPI0014207BBF|nr:septum formation family protein [Actinomyces sp. ZJ308]